MMKTRNTITVLFLAAVLVTPGAWGGDLARVDFLNEDTYAADGGVFGEFATDDADYFDCGSAEPDPFDLLDPEDNGEECVPDPSVNGVGTSTVSGGGRWIMATVGGNEPPYRAVGVNFVDFEVDGCTALAGLALGGEQINGSTQTCSCAGGPCFVQARMSADRVFKKGATRQAFSITIVKFDAVEQNRWRPEARINYINPLYICDTGDPDVRTLQTDSCTPGDNVALAELCDAEETVCANPLGRWNLPIQIYLHRVQRPDSDGGGGVCVLLPKGASCESDQQCCSGKCTGKQGTKTCK